MLHLHLMDMAGQVYTDPAVWHGVPLPRSCPLSETSFLEPVVRILWMTFPESTLDYNKGDVVEKGNFPAMRR
jgi:hypothetical protein